MGFGSGIVWVVKLGRCLDIGDARKWKIFIAFGLEGVFMRVQRALVAAHE